VYTRIVHQYLAELTVQGKADKTLHAHACAIRTLLRFWHAEHYLPSPVIFVMPRMEKKRLPFLTAEQLNTVLSFCTKPADIIASIGMTWTS